MSKVCLKYLVPAIVLAGAGASPASADTRKDLNVTGNVASACSITSGSVAVTAAKPGNGSGAPVTFTAPTNVVMSCNKASGALRLSSTRLTGPNTRDYTVRVAGWGANIDYATGAGSPTTPAPTQGTNPNAATVTLVFSCPAGCTGNNLSNTSTYSATLTLTVVATL